MQRITAVIFDLGGVLVTVDFDRMWARITGLAAEGVRPEALMDTDLMTRWCTGRIPPDEFRRIVCGRNGLDMDLDRFSEWWSDLFDVMPGMEDLIADVTAVMPVGLLSDTDPIHWPCLRDRHAFLRAIPLPTLSFQTGFLKPSREAFLTAADHVGSPPGQCLFVDDVERNVAAAREAGMTAVRFTGAADLRAAMEDLGLPLAGRRDRDRG